MSKDRTKPRKLKTDKRYTDAPRYKVIYGYEDEFRDAFPPIASQMVKEIVTTAKGMLNA